MVFAALVAPVLAGSFQSKDIEAYCQAGLKDVTFTGTIKKASPTEAGKIDTDWKRNLSFRTFDIAYEEPFKFRADSRADDTTVVVICTSTMQFMKIPKVRISQKVDITNEPGKRQTVFEMGMLTPSIATNYFQDKFVRFDRETGNPVFDLTWPAKWDNTSRMRVWIDKTDKYIVRREWYGQLGQLKATYYYSNPVRIKGMMFPTVQKTFNAENKLAAEIQFSNLKANEGISDALFIP